MNKLSERRIQFNSTEYLQPPEEINNVINEFFVDQELSNLNILDAGCRLGEYKRAYDKMNAHAIGVDFNKSCIEYCKMKFPSSTEDYILADITNLYMLKNSTFDIVFGIGVMSYLSKREIDTCLKGFQRILTKEGQIVLVFQKKQSYVLTYITKAISLLPLKIYKSILIPILEFILYPFSTLILGKKVSREYFKYGVVLSLKNVNYGYPSYLEEFKISTPTSGPFSPKRSVSFRIFKNTPLGKINIKGSLD
jgi:hypothetical protein